jgi:DNA gyrase subunit A
MTDDILTYTPDVRPTSLVEEMRRSDLDYAMSVIVSRALPDVRDGLKPVHRRILYAMLEGGYTWNRPFRKSARIVGDVMGKYHPHGDSAIYDALVRMAQDFSMRLPLIEGQGNFGSLDGDPAAAMRYTEARLATASEALLADIDKETVAFQPNYDESMQEPTVLPARYPNLLVNGAGGIAVGMATNIPPHNLGEVIDGCLALLDNPDLTVADLLQLIPGPDFPTGALIMGRVGCRDAATNGRGSVLMRARTSIEEVRKDREAIIISEIPYQVNKARMIERIAEAVEEKIVEGISDVRDESDRDGVRVVIELKRDAVAEIVLNQLYKHTALQTSFGVNALALVHGQPLTLSLKDMLRHFLEFREEVITKRTAFDLRQARERAHVLIGLAVSVANVDEVIRVIRHAPDPAAAREALLARDWPAESVMPLIRLVETQLPAEQNSYRLSQAQAKAILELRLQRLTGLERDKIRAELEELVKQIQDFLAILASRARRIEVMRGELTEFKEKFATPRRTQIMDADGAGQNEEDLIVPEDMVVTISHSGYVKRVPVDSYRAQRRGGKGRLGMTTRDEDAVTEVFVANTHDPVLFFTNNGRAFELKVYKLPLSTPQARGKAMVNLLPLQKDEKIAAVLPLDRALLAAADSAANAEPDAAAAKDSDIGFLMFATSHGTVRRNDLSDFRNIKSNGKLAMKLEEGEKLIAVQLCHDGQDILLVTREGKGIRFAVDDVRVFQSRASTGVRGIKLAKGDVVVAMTALTHVAATAEDRDAYLRYAAAQRRAASLSEDALGDDGDEGDTANGVTISDDMIQQLQAQEEFILTVTEGGFGKRSSAYAYRTTGRGGSGILTMEVTPKVGKVIDSFPVDDRDEIILVTSGGQMIRCPVAGIRIAGRRTQGVTLFKFEDDDRVVSVSRIAREGDDSDGAPTPPATTEAQKTLL